MDLISKEALLNDLCEDREEGTFTFTAKQAKAADKVIRYITDRIQAQPSVPAVPLDKLCEYLSATCACPPNKEEIQKRCLTAQCALCWKESITKWMEEQDADRQ